MNNMAPDIEKALITKVAAGNEDSFREFVDAYHKTVYSYVFRATHEHVLAEEVVQDVFLRLWQTRELLLKVDNFGGYLRTVTRNYSLNALKKLLKQRSREVSWDNELEQVIEETNDFYFNLLTEAVNNLPPQQQRIWILNRQLRKSYSEIAKELNISKETVKKHLQVATASVTSYLTDRNVPFIVLIFLLQ